jgi:hypothetical protein
MKRVRRFGLLLVVFAVALSACVPATQPAPDQVTPETTPVQPDDEATREALNTPDSEGTLVIPETGPAYTYNLLVDDLTAAGREPIPAGTLEQPFFDVAARVLTVNGEDIQVFEFADVQTRQTAEDTITAGGSVIGTSQITWVDIPNFWSRGRILVLYIGQNEELIDLLDEVIGQRITFDASGNRVLPITVDDAQRFLADQLGIDISRIQVNSFSVMDWPDACLGLAGQGEMCAQVVTPGYQVILQVDGQQYDVRTDTSGSVIRYSQR